MNNLTIFGKNSVENDYLKAVSKEKIAYFSDELWEIVVHEEIDSFKEYVLQEPLIQIAYIDITVNGALEVAELLRKRNKDVVILLIADTTISPLVYIRPSIMAAALLLRPIKKNVAMEQITEIVRLFSHTAMDLEGYFSLEYKGEKINVPYDKILYFEARDKKVYLGMENKEYVFYKTIAALEEELPAYFCKCHRSIIVNTQKINKISWESDTVELETGVLFPVSRRCKKNLREM